MSGLLFSSFVALRRVYLTVAHFTFLRCSPPPVALRFSRKMVSYLDAVYVRRECKHLHWQNASRLRKICRFCIPWRNYDFCCFVLLVLHEVALRSRLVDLPIFDLFFTFGYVAAIIFCCELSNLSRVASGRSQSPPSLANYTCHE